LAEPCHTDAIDELAHQAGLHVDPQKSLQLAHTDLWAASLSGSEQLVGFAITQRLGDELELLDLATRVEVRRQGVASALLDQILKVATVGKVAAVLLEVRAENTAAIRLYQKLGFVVVHRRINYYRCPPDDALCMRLALASRPHSPPPSS
jgi:ribosomal protein S18 acetylase RimI-like enzyme